MEEGSSEAAVQDDGALSATSVGTTAVTTVVRKSVKRSSGLGRRGPPQDRAAEFSPPCLARRCPPHQPRLESTVTTPEGWRGVGGGHRCGPPDHKQGGQDAAVKEPHQPQQQQSQPQPHVQQQQPQKQAQPVMHRAPSIAARQAAMAQQSQETNPVSPKIKRHGSAKGGPAASVKPAAAAASTAKPDENPKKSEAKAATFCCRVTAATVVAG
ncbi:hypothetical protein ZWY2020_014946 [Hordeum vulgare]|nr:hypothetical protein ZWY2020_014946 [Hordeum vulgare]